MLFGLRECLWFGQDSLVPINIIFNVTKSCNIIEKGVLKTL